LRDQAVANPGCGVGGSLREQLQRLALPARSVSLSLHDGACTRVPRGGRRRGGGETKFAIEVDGEAVGGIGVIPGADIERFSAEIGYWLGEPFWGRGIVSEALILISERAFERLNLLRLFALAFAENAASTRVLEKAGYACEGVLKSGAVKHGRVYDQLLYARVNPAWRGAQ
jgi:RimJ/RimL family protein N-acetyltransferase